LAILAIGISVGGFFSSKIQNASQIRFWTALSPICVRSGSAREWSEPVWNLRRTAAFRLLQRPDDVGIQMALRRQVASWKGPRVGEYRRAARLRTLKQPEAEGCGPSAVFTQACRGGGPATFVAAAACHGIAESDGGLVLADSAAVLNSTAPRD